MVPYPSEEKKTQVKLQIWDTAGQEKFRTICQTYYRGSHGIMMVYDVTNRDSFESIQMWLKEVNVHAGSDVVKLLIGTKSDKQGRVVTLEEGQNLAKQMNVMFLETSAQNGDNVEKAFQDLAIEVMKQQGSFQAQRPDQLLEKVVRDDQQRKKKCCE